MKCWRYHAASTRTSLLNVSSFGPSQGKLLGGLGNHRSATRHAGAILGIGAAGYAAFQFDSGFREMMREGLVKVLLKGMPQNSPGLFPPAHTRICSTLSQDLSPFLERRVLRYQELKADTLSSNRTRLPMLVMRRL